MRRPSKPNPQPVAALVCLMAAFVLQACQPGDPEPEPAPTNSDGPRSIFSEGGAAGGDVAPETLPPLETTLSFPDGTAELTEAVRAELVTITGSPQVAAGGRIVLRGHSDTQGPDEENLESSRERAEAVATFLVDNGVAEERIRVIAFGEQNPIAPNALPDGSPNEEGRAANRRVEVTVRAGPVEDREPTIVEALSESAPGDDARAVQPGESASGEQ